MTIPIPYLDKRPWGEEMWLLKGAASSPSMVKIITVNPGESLSLQYHMNREEFWVVISGNGTATVGEKNIPLSKGASCYVPKEAHHRITGGTETLVFVEMTFGNFDESDIVRLEDKYGRVINK